MTATWATPKTDWSGSTIDGVYTGDYFNAVDYNRIKNNLIYLHELSVELGYNFNLEFIDMGNDKSPGDYFTAREINNFWTNYVRIGLITSIPYYTAITYYDNGATPTALELNQLESGMLRIYDRLTNQYNNRRMFVWNFGIRTGGFV